MMPAANDAPLTPLSFLPRAAAVFPDRTAVIHGPLRQSWAGTLARCVRLASALTARGVQRGEVVSILSPNTPALYEAQFGVPMAGAVLNPLNTRLTADEIAFQLDHGRSRVLLVDSELAGAARGAVARLSRPPLVVDIVDPMFGGRAEPVGALDYEALLAEGSPDADWSPPTDERDPISLNYTSGTTGDPKGVLVHHRGAHLNALAQIIGWSMPANPVYLWTLPMFHCNGWCFPWAVAAQGGTNVCLRGIDPPAVVDLMEEHAVSHLCGAPVVYSLLIDELARRNRPLARRVDGMIAGAAPPSALIERGEAAGFDLLHVYGLTEVYGPAALCQPQADWADRPVAERARLIARQGVAMLSQDAMRVLDPDTLSPVPANGRAVGEIMFRGNATMTGYLRNPDATAAAFAGGWFHSGDLAVVDPDGYARITDRSKDVIISGGENVSSLEVEDVLHRHPAVSLAAVVAMPHDRWGEVPCAFVELREGQDADAATLTAHCRDALAGYKVPKRFEFGELPKTSTGKVQKGTLRKGARSAELG